MEIMYPSCAGLELREHDVIVCVRRLVNDTIRQEVRSFTPEVRSLLSLADWLVEEHVTHAALEPTSSSWKTVWCLLAQSCEVLLVNADHIKQVPGRKEAVEDCRWIAELLQHGLLRSGQDPSLCHSPLQALLRERARLMQQKLQAVDRIVQRMEEADVAQVSDRLGPPARDLVSKLVRRATSSGQWLPQKSPGRRMEEHELFLVEMLADEVEFWEKQAALCGQRIIENWSSLLLEEAKGLASTRQVVPFSETGAEEGNPAGARAEPLPERDPVSESTQPQPEPTPSSSVSEGDPTYAVSATEEARRERRRGRRVRVITNEDRYRQHQKKKLWRIVKHVLVWPLILLIGGFLFWLILDRLLQPPRE